MLNMANVHDVLESTYINSRRESKEGLQDLKIGLPTTAVGEYSISYREALRQERIIKEGLKENKHNLSPNQVESIYKMYEYLVNEALHTGKLLDIAPISRPDAYRELAQLHDETEKRTAVDFIYSSDVIYIDSTKENLYCVYNKQVHVIELR